MARQRKRRGWFSFLGGAGGDPPGTRYELVVLEGANTGARYALDRPQLQIGRGIPGRPSEGGIDLGDRSVSAKHALLSCEDGVIRIEHLPSATNPTLVNGRRIKRKRVRDGDRIVLGLVVLELRANIPEPPAPSPATPDRVPPSQIETDPVNVPVKVNGVLVLREGIDDRLGERFPLARRRTSIGRDEDCDIVLDVAAVSRNHAALVWQDDQLILIHESAVNPTHVNDMEIADRRRLFDGDEIRISERVRFEIQLEASVEKPAAGPAPTPAEEATRLTRPPAVDVDATRIDETPEPLPEPTPGEAPAAGEMATRVFALPHEPVAPSASTSTTSDFGAGAGETSSEATRIAPAPAAPHFSEGDATRIAPAPAAPSSSPDLTRIAGDAGATDAEASADRDEAKTLIRPSPVAEAADLDDLDDLKDSERTIVRPPPTASGSAGATVIRPRPEERDEAAPAAETVILQDDEDES